MSRILLITDIFPPDIGGPATFIDQLGRHLSDVGHQSTVFCTSERPTDTTDQGRPFRVRRYPRRPPSISHSLGLRLALALEIARHEYVFCNGIEFPTYQVCQLLRRPYVLKVVSDRAWETAWNTGLTRLSVAEFQSSGSANAALDKLLRQRSLFARHAHRIITPSEYLSRLVIGWGVDARRVSTVHNGVPLPKATEVQPRRRDTDRLNLAFVGRLIDIKGIDVLLQALAGLPAVSLVLVGDGPEEQHLRALAQRLQVAESVTFAGRQTRNSTQALILDADVLVLASAHEGLSHVLLEALALGVPCIASDRGGNPEVIRDGENGLLVPYGDVQRLRAAIQRLQGDEGLRYRLACQAKTSSQQFDLETTLRETTRILLNR